MFDSCKIWKRNGRKINKLFDCHARLIKTLNILVELRKNISSLTHSLGSIHNNQKRIQGEIIEQTKDYFNRSIFFVDICLIFLSNKRCLNLIQSFIAYFYSLTFCVRDFSVHSRLLYAQNHQRKQKEGG